MSDADMVIERCYIHFPVLTYTLITNIGTVPGRHASNTEVSVSHCNVFDRLNSRFDLSTSENHKPGSDEDSNTHGCHLTCQNSNFLLLENLYQLYFDNHDWLVPGLIRPVSHSVDLVGQVQSAPVHRSIGRSAIRLGLVVGRFIPVWFRLVWFRAFQLTDRPDQSTERPSD